MYCNMCRGKERSSNDVWQIRTWLWCLSFQLSQSQEESLILIKLLLDLLAAKQWDFATGGSSLQCAWALFFPKEFCHQWSLTAQRAGGEAGLWGGESVETLIFLSSRKTQANRELCLLAIRQGCNSGTIHLAKTTLWAFLALNFHNPVKGSACCNFVSSPSPMFGHHPCGHCSFVSRQSLPLFFSHPCLLATQLVLKLQLCPLGFLPTHGSGGNLDVPVPSHSPCSCSPLEGGGRLSFVSHPVRRSLQGLSTCTQGRTPRSEHEELLWMESSSSKERGRLQQLENHLWYWTPSLSKPNQTTPCALKV